MKNKAQRRSKKVSEDKTVKKENAKTAKKPDKRLVEKKIEKDSQVERKEPPRKRMKKASCSLATDDGQPQATSGRGRGKKVAKNDTGEPSEDVKAVKIEVKEETDAPTKKLKKGEVQLEL